MRALVACSVALTLVTAGAGAAWGSFPYAPGGNPQDPSTFRLPGGANQAPNDLTGKLEWMYAATPEANNLPVNLLASELSGVRGASLGDNADIDQGWRTTTGRPDVTIAVLDSGIKWDDEGAMEDLRLKTRLSRGELPVPNHGRAGPLDGGKACADFTAAYDANGDGVFNVRDYACDTRVERDPAARATQGKPRGVGPADMLDPQDVLIAFSDGTDADGNGFRDDIVGWDFLDDDNDPYDDVQYGHGTGEARDSTAEADNGGELGTCPNCTSIHMRVGDSFIADEGRFAQATLYAVDNGALVVQEALGTINNTAIARQSIEYAYDHGVAVIASAADEAAQHHNWPSSQPHVIMVNSVTKYDDTFTRIPQSYLQFNGCTNFFSKLSVAIPSVSCSSDATGRGSGMAGLIYSAALNEGLEHPTCRRTNGAPCPLTANEVRQLMSGTADDVNFATVELSCEPVPVAGCTDPNLNSINLNRVVLPFPLTLRYPARKGFDMFYGHGRVNMNRALDAVTAGALSPEAEITSPDWYTQVDPGQASLQVRGEVGVRSGSYTCVLEAAPGSQPNNDSDFEPVASSWCNGGSRTGRFTGVIGTVNIQALKARFPVGPGDFRGREQGLLPQSSNGRPNSEPYGFTLRLRVTQGARVGQDRRNLYVHRDRDMLPGFPRSLGGDGESSPVFADLDGDNRNELIISTANGRVNAFKPDGSQATGWPVRGDPRPLHTGGRAFTSGEVSADASLGAFLAAPAVGDLDRDGSPEVVAADFEGRVYAWDAAGRRVWTRRSREEFSGKPLSPFVHVRRGHRHRVQRGFIGSPVLADLDRNDGGRLEVIGAPMDRHVYAWNHDGSGVSGFPRIVVDPAKVASIDATTHMVTFNANAGDELDQGAIIDTPAVGDISGDARPEIVVGTNEEYAADAPGEGGLNAGGVDISLLAPLTEVAGLDTGNSRLYAINAAGGYVPGWPVKIGLLATELLPIVGEGMTGAPIIGPADCGDGGPVIGAMPGAGFGYLLNPDGSSCLGTQSGKPRVLALTPPANANQDTPALPAIGHPAFAPLGDSVAFLAPAAGLRRALDVAVSEYQQGGQDFVAAWNTESGGFRAGFPARVNDLQFLTGPSIADIDGNPGQEIVAGTASLDLVALTGSGGPLSSAWPKFTSDWTIANPLIGSFGVLETDAGARKTVVGLTRSGLVLAYRTGAPACSPGAWPRFHHDNANSGFYDRDAVAPGKPTDLSLDGETLRFRGVGDDLLCGTPARYEVLSSRTFAAARSAARSRAAFTRMAAEPRTAGQQMSVGLPPGHGRLVGVRAVDEQGNAGPLGIIDTGAGSDSGSAAKPCLPRRLGVSARRIGPARLGRRLTALRRRYRVVRRRGRTTRFCVRGGGRFLVMTRRRKIDLIASTAKGHRTRHVRVGKRLRDGKLKGARRVRPRLLVGHKGGKSGRVLYGVRRGKVRYLAVVRPRSVKRPAELAKRLRRLGLR